jgi:16S rRNA (guanine(966)-N(2))-methyltransferase RsmD
MRIISGKYKGRRITAPKNLPIRPTTDKAKEALFNILQNQFYLPELKVLDLFTGSGGISYEFASRGSKDIQAIDSHFPVTKFVKKISNEFDFPIKVIKYDAKRFLEKTTDTYDIIFADPPYNFTPDELNELVNIAFERNLINENGLFILEHIDRYNFDDHPFFKESRKYGLSRFSFFSPNKKNE